MKRESLAGRWKIWVGILLLKAGIIWTCPIFVFAAGNQSVEREMEAAILDDTSGAALEEAPSFQYFSSRLTSSGWDYGDQLSGNELQIYKTLESVTDMKEYYYESSSSKKGIQVKLSQPYICSGTTGTYRESSGYQKAQKEWNRATHAYIRDYGEKYWIYYFVIGMQYSVGNDCVIIDSLTLYPRDYYSEIRSEFGITDEALNQAIQKIRGISGRYKKVKAAHDYVAELVTYNSANLNAAYGHTITGGLLEKYNHLGVCECYAKLFRLICEKNGIPCILVTGGKSKDSSGNVIANHMWNYVQMEDGNWYVVDVTWDDQSYGIYTNYFLAGYNSQGFNGKKVGEDHLPVGCFSSSVSYETFILPAMAMEAYETASEIEVTGITLDQTTMIVEEDGTSQLDVSGYLPENANVGKEVKYVSSDPLVAEVDTSGKILGKKPGTAVITVSSREYPEVKTQCTVTVRAHVYGNPVTEKEATCLEDGVKRYTCTNAGCSAEKKEPVPAKGHTSGEWKVTKAATCTEAGKKVKNCTVCQKQLEEAEIPATGHSYGSWQTVTAATCESAEVQKRTCVCGASETRSYGSAKEHTVEWEVVKAATCTEAGKKIEKCTVCQKYLDKEEKIPATGHSYGSWQTVTAATCESAEVQKRTCAYCGASETRSGSAKEHTAGEWKVTKAATCTETGKKVKNCTVCQKQLEEAEIPATGHSYGSWQTVTAATCESAEVQKRTCAYCGASETRSYGSAKGHTAGEWKVTKSATGSKTGVKEQYCSVCGKKIASESIARTKVTLNASSIPLQRKKSTTALKIKSYTKGDSVAQWTSDKPSIVSVNKKTGKLTAKKNGKAVITVTMKSGAKASCIVNVQSGTVKTTRITVPKSAVTLKTKQTYTIKVTRTPITTQETVKFSSSNKKIATVSSKGKITAKKKGKATITVRSGKKYVKIKVTVK